MHEIFENPKSISPFIAMLKQMDFPLTYDDGEWGEYTIYYPDADIFRAIGQIYCTLNPKQREMCQELFKDGLQKLQNLNNE